MPRRVAKITASRACESGASECDFHTHEGERNADFVLDNRYRVAGTVHAWGTSVTRISFAATACVVAGLGLLLWPFAFGYLGDLTLHAELIFKVWPACFCALFVGTLVEEIFDV
jgi:hypothetical protein